MHSKSQLRFSELCQPQVFCKHRVNWRELQSKRSKGVKMTSFFSAACHGQQWEFMLEEEMLDTYLPLPLLLPSLNLSICLICLILFLLSKPRPEESLHLCSDTSRLLHFHQGLQCAGLYWTVKERRALQPPLFGKSEWCSQALVQVHSNCGICTDSSDFVLIPCSQDRGLS